MPKPITPNRTDCPKIHWCSLVALIHFISFSAGVHKTGDLNLVRNSPPYPNQTEPTSPLVIRYLFTDQTHDV